jgi:hypothetical protein
MALEAHQATTENSVLLGPLSALARQRKTWAPELLAGVVWRGLTNFGAHRQVLRLLKLPSLAEAARNNPRFAFKYLTHDYLVRGLTTAQRASCFLHHYRCLHAALSDLFLRQTLLGETLLHEINTDSNRFAVTMGLSRDFDKEGELSLNLHVDGEIVFLLAFTIVPGAVVESEASEVLLISRLQGMKGAYRQVHLATRALHNVAPGALLLSVLQGIALAFGIGQIAAVTAVRQSSYTADSAAVFKQAYDEFFIGLGIPETAAGFFLTPVPVEPKPLAQVKKGHKIRTKEKRAFKQQILSDSAAFFAKQILVCKTNPGLQSESRPHG